MTNSEPEKPDDTAGTAGIDDDQLPEDLQPSEDNPLAEPLSDGDDTHSVDELDMQGGKTPEGTDGDDVGEGDGDGDGSSA